MGAAIAGMIVAACATSVASDSRLTELCSVSRPSATALAPREEPTKPRMYHAQPANGPVPLAHRVSKPVKADSSISIVRDPVDPPPPIGGRAPRRVKVELETIEATRNLADGATYRYWTFNQKVPGPFVRVRVGDTVEVRLTNDENSVMMHNVDFHAVNGPGGGAGATSANPGETKQFNFKALNPGLYVYHCAVAPVAMHISSGMYGIILVEPEEGLNPSTTNFT